MNSPWTPDSAEGAGWRAEIRSVFRKELRTELRSRSGLLSALLFSVSTVVAISFAGYREPLPGSLAGGLLGAMLIFAASLALSRTFVVEEDQGTGDLLRLMARPHAVYWGKTLFNVAQMLLFGVAISALFLLFTGLEVMLPSLFALCLFGFCVSLAGAVTLSGALVAQAASRSVLAVVISLPLLLPLIVVAIAGFRVAFGEGTFGGWPAGFGLIGYAAASLAIGPPLFAEIWKE